MLASCLTIKRLYGRGWGIQAAFWLQVRVWRYVKSLRGVPRRGDFELCRGGPRRSGTRGRHTPTTSGGSINERRGGNGEDLVSLLINADVGGERLGDYDLIFETMLVLVVGDETTRHAISGGLEALLHRPDQLEELRRNPSLLQSAIEEMLRWVTPIRT